MGDIVVDNFSGFHGQFSRRLGSYWKSSTFFHVYRDIHLVIRSGFAAGWKMAERVVKERVPAICRHRLSEGKLGVQERRV